MRKVNGLAIFDMDGVLANCEKRLRYVYENDMDSFYDSNRIMNDEPIREGFALLNMFKCMGYKIIILTSRRSECREATMEWLKKNGCAVKSNELFMRPSCEKGKSWEVKRNLMLRVATHQLYNKYFAPDCNVFFIDDYPENCKAVDGMFYKVKTLTFGTGRFGDLASEL